MKRIIIDIKEGSQPKITVTPEGDFIGPGEVLFWIANYLLSHHAQVAYAEKQINPKSGIIKSLADA